MRVEVDQSGRIEYTKEDTALAFSDDTHFSILIPASVKRICVRELRDRSLSGPTLYTQLFATALFLLLKDHIRKISPVIIDVEYKGKEAQIKEHLLHLFQRHNITVYPDEIDFDWIGEKSPAHFLALETFRGDKDPDLEISEDDLLREFKK